MEHSLTHFPLIKLTPLSQLEQILGCVVHVLHGELQGMQLPDDVCTTVPAGHVEKHLPLNKFNPTLHDKHDPAPLQNAQPEEQTKH